jgi:hypothetical protein
LLLAAAASAATIRVPADQPTIQAAINVALNGDVIQVSAGTYRENLDFLGKTVTVTSVSGPSLTIVDGGAKASVVSFQSGEGAKAVLTGFTLRNGLATNLGSDGGGVFISGASPTVQNNIITANQACGGAGVYITAGSPVIRSNTITKNSQTGCAGDGGAGIYVLGGTSPSIIANKITSNTQCCGDGGGIFINGTLSPVVMNNIIMSNVSSGSGGGIAIINQADVQLVQNLIARNQAASGAGVYWSVPENSTGLMVNNTVHGNTLTQTCTLCQGSSLYLEGFYSSMILENNLFLGTRNQDSLYCDTTYGSDVPTLIDNDAWSPGSSAGFGGGCAGQAGQSGNITADPLLVDTAHNNYRLSTGSPAIDVGDNNTPDLPQKDLGGGQRIVNGNGGPIAIVDMGVYEYVPQAR